MKKALIFVAVLTLIMPLGFSFLQVRDYIADIVDTADGAIETVKGIFGNDVYNSSTPQQNDVGDEVLELGIGGERRQVNEYVEYRLKNENIIFNEEFMHVKHVSNTLYDVYVRNTGDFFRKRFTAMRLTLSFENQNDHYEIDVLWVGPYTFDNTDLEEFIGYEGEIHDTYCKSSLFWYKSDGMLSTITNTLNIIGMSGGKYNSFGLCKIPKSISVKEQTFLDYWDEWTGG